ncbi:hypothetical protein [Kitasatospora sp. NPDC088351]|uniref:hypothetical protein n=1 Tax=unclassified Kitasatospora TaxID=2633591 RepID=UPI00344786DB
MRNGLVQLGAWAAATGAAVALSWLGVHAVLTGAAFEQPTALPLPSPASSGTRPTPTPTPTSAQAQTQASSTPQPQPPAPPSTPAAPTTQRSPVTAATAQPSSRRPVPTATPTSTVRSYPVPGGKVALDIRSDSASLVSATPDPGWTMRVWNGEQWLRVDFTKDDQTNSVIAYWNGHPPIVDPVIR